MGKNKRVMSIVLLFSVIFCLLNTSVINAHASGWLDYVQNIELETSYTDMISTSDCYITTTWGGSYYCDAYKFTVPIKGTITLYLESADSDTFNGTLYLYNAANPDKAIWNSSMHYERSTARGVYFGTVKNILNAGTYYLVIEARATDLGVREHTIIIDDTYTFNISFEPAISKSTIKKVKNQSHKATITWMKVGGASGYEIQYSTSKKFAKSKTKTIKINNANTSKKVIKNLRKNQTYYFRIRAVKKVMITNYIKTYYSPWSSKKKIKIG